MEKLEYGEKISFVKVFVKSIVLAWLLSLLLIFILSILMSMTNLKENIMAPAIIFISTVSILWGSFKASKKIKQKGILWGALIGGIYMLLMYLVSSLLNMNFALDLNAIIMIAFGILGGAIGGVLGVNFH